MQQATVRELVPGDWGKKESVYMLNPEKFAELIVRECAKFLEENSGYDNANNSWHPEPEDLLQNFGFEPEKEQKNYCPTCGEEWSGTSCGADDCGFIVR